MNKSSIPKLLSKTPVTITKSEFKPVRVAFNIKRDTLPVGARIKRRSNSFSDATIEEKRAHALSRGKVNLQSVNKESNRRAPGALRKSKSYSDLRALTSVKAVASTSRQGSKRPISGNNELENKRSKVNIIQETHTVKVSKPAVKPAPYDFKAKYNLLLDKYKILREAAESKTVELNSANGEIARLNDIEKKLEESNKEKDVLENKLIQNKNATKILEQKLAENYSLIDALEEKVKELGSRCDMVQNQCKTLEVANDKLTKKYFTSETELVEAKEIISKQIVTINTYQYEVQKHEKIRKILHNTVQDLKGNIRVFCRVRPSLSTDKMECLIRYDGENSLEIKKSKESISSINGKVNESKLDFCFDKVFPPETEQREIFEELSQLVQSALDGYHICIFAYGQTGSGKTYTMQGDRTLDGQGMIPRSIQFLFDVIQNLERTEWTYRVQASFLEIYNENVRDLLEPNSKQQYRIQFNEGKGVTVSNLKIENVHSAEDLTSLMHKAERNRAVAVTDYNEHSSRSHAVTKIYLKGINNISQIMYEGSLNLVDLAGSETARSTVSERLIETKNINKSLSTLGSVMLALHNKSSHIPYRNSKLTYLLQSCLGGNSKTLMIVNIPPSEECFSETVNSLRFAANVKEVKTESKRQKVYGKLD